MPKRRPLIADNIFAHCDVSAGPSCCWPFLRSKNKQGYGHVWVNGRCEEAHRFAYSVAVGPIPDEMWVLHSCDFPSCCNPAHLRLGTPHDNAQDREVRARGNQPKGGNNGNAKLTTQDIIFIRRCQDIYTLQRMAEMLGVGKPLVHKIIVGTVWGHVADTALGAAAIRRVA